MRCLAGLQLRLEVPRLGRPRLAQAFFAGALVQTPGAPTLLKLGHLVRCGPVAQAAVILTDAPAMIQGCLSRLIADRHLELELRKGEEERNQTEEVGREWRDKEGQGPDLDQCFDMMPMSRGSPC